MSLLPSYTSPPAITWISSYWADDPKTGGGFVNANLDAIQSTEHVAYKALRQIASVNPLTFTRYDPLLNNRGSWTVPATGGMSARLTATDTTAIGSTFSMVWIGYLPPFTSGWTTSGGPRLLTAPGSGTGAGIGATSGSTASLLDGNYHTYTNTGGGNANYFTRRAIVGQPHMLVLVLDGAGGARIMVNGETYGPGSFSDATATLTHLYMGGNSNEVAYRVGFVGWYDGDIRSDPLWSNFKTWTQNHYGFDPAATYGASAPPPIPWRAEYLADDYDQSTGTWTDRGGKGYSLIPGSTCIKSTGLVVSGTPSATNSAKVDWFAGLDFTGDFEVQVKWFGVRSSTSNIVGCASGSAASYRWALTISTGNLALLTSNGAGYITYTSTSPLPSNYESLWLRATWTKNEGGNAVARFYYGWDGVNWTQLGNAVSNATFSLPTGFSLPCYMGGYDGSGNNTISPAILQRFKLLDGIGGPAILDVDFTANAGLSSFTESSSNARTVTVSPGTPTKVTNVVNGQSVVRFDGVDDYLKASGMSLAAPLTVVAVARARGTVTTPTFVGTDNSVGAPIGANTVAPNWTTRLVTSNSVPAGGTNPTNWNLIRAYDNGSTGGVFAVNETVLASGLTIGAMGIVDLVLAAQGGGTNNPSDVDIAYVGVYWGDVTTTALWSAFKTWVTSKYGITLA